MFRAMMSMFSRKLHRLVFKMIPEQEQLRTVQGGTTEIQALSNDDRNTSMISDLHENTDNGSIVDDDSPSSVLPSVDLPANSTGI